MKPQNLIYLCGLFAAGAAYGPVHYNPAPLNKDGTVADTHEVAAAKHDHLARLAKAGGAVPHLSHYSEPHYVTPSYSPVIPAPAHAYSSPAANGHDYTPKWHGPPAPLNHDGTVAETPEVKHATAAHLAAVAETLKRVPYHGGPQDIGYHGRKRRWVPYSGEEYEAPSSKKSEYPRKYKSYKGAPLNRDGTVDETPEVKAAKAVHLSAFADASYGNNFLPSVQQPQQPLYYQTGPERSRNLFVPAPLNHDGTVAETPEIKAAKEAHFQAHAHFINSYPIFPENYDGHYNAPEPVNFNGPAPGYYSVAAPAFRSTSLPVHASQPIFNQRSFETNYKTNFIPAPLNPDGTVAETPEVLARREEHAAEYNRALARAG